MPDNRLTLAAATDIITSRSKYHWQPRWTGTFKTSDLVPIYAKSSIRPGDTVKMRISAVVRGLQPVFPVMDDAYLSIECFFVKHKHLLSRASMTPNVNDSNHSWSAWLGAQDNTLNMPLPDNDITLPHMFVFGPSASTASNAFLIGGLADCLKMPPVQAATNDYYLVNCLKPLAYCSIWNSYFREPSTQVPITFSLSSAAGIPGVSCDINDGDAGIVNGYSVSTVGSMKLATVCREHGYFGSALPWPQRNSTGIELPLGDLAPVGAMDSPHKLLDGDASLLWAHPDGSDYGTAISTPGYLQVASGGTYTTTTAGTVGQDLAPSNLYTDLSAATAATVNQVRYAFAAQRWFEQLARSGNRYDELVFGMTGVRQKDSYDDRPEYLGGKRIPIGQNQVNSTSGPSSTAGGLGAVGAFTHMADDDYYFTKSFDDFGTLMVVAYVRVHDTFHQGIAREDTVFDKFDIFWSQFANIGEVPIKNKEIFVDGTSNDDGVFGYQEAWADYRLELDGVTGYARPNVTGGYPFVTYANDFQSLPGLKSFLTSTQVSNVDQTLAVQSVTSNFQWLGQFMFDMDVVRQVPTYSIPGYIDHH